jgi:site-specific DNA-cytosine methylase
MHACMQVAEGVQDSYFYGVGQSRPRVFILAARSDHILPEFPTPPYSDSPPTLGDLLASRLKVYGREIARLGDKTMRDFLVCLYKLTVEGEGGRDPKAAVERVMKLYGFDLKRLAETPNTERVQNTMTQLKGVIGSYVGVQTKSSNAYLPPRVRVWLQGLDGHAGVDRMLRGIEGDPTVEGVKGVQMTNDQFDKAIGNAVVPQVAEAFAREMMKADEIRRRGNIGDRERALGERFKIGIF